MSEVPAVPGRRELSDTTSLRERVAAVFEPDGPLARALPGFEARAGQVDMADAVATTLDAGGVLLAEAGTGTGKTLAYLIPAILSRQRVLVSTGTKTLQEQIFFKDVPLLREALDVPFTAAYMKGRGNYLCLHRLDVLTGEAQTIPAGNKQTRPRGGSRSSAIRGAAPLMAEGVFLPIIREWAKRTETGDRAELEDLPEDLPFWSDVSASIETCLGTDCPRYNDCFVTRMRQRAAESDLVIVNHHLLCADVAVRQNAFGEVIPACATAVLDEAHQLEDVVTQYFGVAVSTYRIENFAHDVERSAGRHGLDAVEQESLGKAVGRLRDHGRRCFDEIGFAHRARGPSANRTEERVRVTADTLAAAREPTAYLAGTLDVLESTLSVLAIKSSGAADEDASDRETDSPADHGLETEALRSLARRAGQLRDDLRFLMRANDPRFVYFAEFRGNGVFLRASPIDVSKIIRELLVERMRTTVLTSATLAVDDSFDYLRTRLGIRDANELRLPSEFDYSRQALLYLPRRMPDPRSPEFATAAGREVIEILKRTQGRAFVLFTSYAGLRALQAVAEMALPYPILVQGSAPRSQLLKQFRETPHAVLFATSSFWQGVDVVGEALSCVIVDKLPFASPGDPITSARIDAIRARGGEPFDEYQVPLAVLTLQQGLGRLIRHRADRGVLVILDPRLRTKVYGRRFISALPPAPVVHELDAVEAFFSADQTAERAPVDHDARERARRCDGEVRGPSSD
ncbi:MAG: ATP-dependent DNA helicase [Acidimicrobiia bacterium]|nr:ATP-dependent DNA helicase [Acidimicrobiia bacterium]